MLYFEEDYADLIEDNDEIDLGEFTGRLMSASLNGSTAMAAIPILVFLSMLAVFWFVAATFYVLICVLIRAHRDRSRKSHKTSKPKRRGDFLARCEGSSAIRQ